MELSVVPGKRCTGSQPCHNTCYFCAVYPEEFESALSKSIELLEGPRRKRSTMYSRWRLFSLLPPSGLHCPAFDWASCSVFVPPHVPTLYYQSHLPTLCYQSFLFYVLDLVPFAVFCSPPSYLFGLSIFCKSVSHWRQRCNKETQPHPLLPSSLSLHPFVLKYIRLHPQKEIARTHTVQLTGKSVADLGQVRECSSQILCFHQQPSQQKGLPPRQRLCQIVRLMFSSQLVGL